MTVVPAFERLTLSRHGSTAVVALANGKVNALDREVLAELLASVDFCERTPDIDALVMTGEGKVFSAGLNVYEVLDHDTDYPRRCWTTWCGPGPDLPQPDADGGRGQRAGHCRWLSAGLCLRPQTAGRRGRIGVTELKVGVAFPNVAVELFRYVGGPRTEQVMLEARLFGAEGALRMGLVHEVLTGSDLPRRGGRRRRTAGIAGRPRLRTGQGVVAAVRPVGHGGRSRPKASTTGYATSGTPPPPGPASGAWWPRRADRPAEGRRSAVRHPVRPPPPVAPVRRRPPGPGRPRRPL